MGCFNVRIYRADRFDAYVSRIGDYSVYASRIGTYTATASRIDSYGVNAAITCAIVTTDIALPFSYLWDDNSVLCFDDDSQVLYN